VDIIHQKEVNVNKNKIQILIIVIVVMFTMLACEFSASTAKISDAYLTPNDDGSGNFTTFSGDQTFYCVVKVANAPEDTTLKAVWTAVDVEGIDPNFMISEFELTTETENEFTFNLQNDQLWPVGTYKVEIFMNGTLEKTLEFDVQ
jgi:hypothetical protein